MCYFEQSIFKLSFTTSYHPGTSPRIQVLESEQLTHRPKPPPEIISYDFRKHRWIDFCPESFYPHGRLHHIYVKTPHRAHSIRDCALGSVAATTSRLSFLHRLHSHVPAQQTASSTTTTIRYWKPEHGCYHRSKGTIHHSLHKIAICPSGKISEPKDIRKESECEIRTSPPSASLTSHLVSILYLREGEMGIVPS